MTGSSQVGANEAHKALLLRAAVLNSLLPPFGGKKHGFLDRVKGRGSRAQRDPRKVEDIVVLKG